MIKLLVERDRPPTFNLADDNPILGQTGDRGIIPLYPREFVGIRSRDARSSKNITTEGAPRGAGISARTRLSKSSAVSPRSRCHLDVPSRVAHVGSLPKLKIMIRSGEPLIRLFCSILLSLRCCEVFIYPISRLKFSQTTLEVGRLDRRHVRLNQTG
jgi:hypothetical protein